ncbi:MAG TPA: GNAT family N-acetyltransferase [Actinomycetota bacterium]|nr:GNAT family N-acetyltransferase [Actinomycetota bacterium]
MLPDGFEIRSPAFDEVEDVAEMLVAVDLADTGTSESDADLIRDQWSSPGFLPSEDAWVINDSNRTILAYGSVTPDGEGKCKSWGVVHHDHRGRGLGAALLDRMEARASERLRGIPKSVLHTAVNDKDASAAALVRSRGFTRVRTFRHLQIDLSAPSPDPGEPPHGIAIGGIEPDRDLQRIHAIFVEAFSGEWGYRPIPFEEWVGNEVEVPSFDPSLWLLATAGDEGVGALTGVVWGDRGWVGELGVLAPWRGRGIASALLRRAFATFAARDLRRVMLNVDSENSTGAVRLYERVGMRTARAWDVYEKRVV